MNQRQGYIRQIQGASSDFKTEFAQQIAELAPETITDGKIDFEKLRELLADDVDTSAERFGLFWPGKRQAIRLAQTPTTATLKPDKEHSKDWDTTQNVFIEGDNLEVLKVLQKHYYGKIKMIYIDPPYNTGKDFVYKDNFKDGVKNYLEWTEQVNEEGKKLSSNAETEGRYHSNWLNMMYPRLKLARNLLTDDGAIYISIDDNELPRLIQLCQEVFGESNVINVIAVKMSELSGVKMSHVGFRLPKVKEYVVVCARNASRFKINALKIEKNRSDGSLTKYLKYYNKIIRNPSDPVTEWIISPVKEVMEELGLQTDPDSVTKYKIENAAHVVYRTNNASLSRLSFDTQTAEVISPTGIKYIWWEGKEMLFLDSYLEEGLSDLWTDISTINLNKETFEIKGFGAGQKPLKLINRILELSTAYDSNDIVLDFFAGSGTTAHAVLKKNHNGSDLNFILVQIPEPVSLDKEGKKARDFLVSRSLEPTISALSRERIKKACEEYNYGYRAYKLVDTNFAKWNLSSSVAEEDLQQELLLSEGSANDDASPEDLLTELLLKQGLSLTEKVLDVEISGLKLSAVLSNDSEIPNVALLVYLDEHIPPTLEQLRAIIAEKPARLAILEDAFQGDDGLKTNLVQMCKTNNIELWTA